VEGLDIYGAVAGRTAMSLQQQRQHFGNKNSKPNDGGSNGDTRTAPAAKSRATVVSE